MNTTAALIEHLLAVTGPARVGRLEWLSSDERDAVLLRLLELLEARRAQA